MTVVGQLSRPVRVSQRSGALVQGSVMNRDRLPFLWYMNQGGRTGLCAPCRCRIGFVFIMSNTSALRAFSHRRFFLFMVGHGVSLCGSWMQSMAHAWLVYRLTGSPFLLGFVEFLARSPILLFEIGRAHV